MLEVLADDRANLDPLAHSRHAGPEGADAANQEVHLDPGLGCGVKRGDAGGIDEGIEFEGNSSGSAGAGVVRLALDHGQDPVAQIHRRHDQPAEIMLT